ncbi:GGDEF domain-containing protein [Blastococcus sp. PRF04-17]|nr:GGDEF domain-containing protein [Blastococcus sp. PRF04-17]UOY01701.1 GGDEF domain-containing protein [Blastococcus sp. PRF04-17]
MHAERRTPAVLLAVLYTVSGVLCLFAAAWPMRPDSPVGVLWTLGTVGVLGGIALRVLAGHLHRWVLHAGVALAGSLLAVLAWHSVTAVGVVSLGPVLIALGLFAAHFFTLTAARAHVALLAVLSTAGALAAEPDVPALQWLTGIVSMAALAEVQGRLARNLRTEAATDPLTGVANRRAWEAEAARNLARAARTGEPLTFAILDLDDFKEVNDREGHGAGDALLRDLTAGWAAACGGRTSWAGTAGTSSCSACRRPTSAVRGRSSSSSPARTRSRGRPVSPRCAPVTR